MVEKVLKNIKSYIVYQLMFFVKNITFLNKLLNLVPVKCDIIRTRSIKMSKVNTVWRNSGKPLCGIPSKAQQVFPCLELQSYLRRWYLLQSSVAAVLNFRWRSTHWICGSVNLTDNWIHMKLLLELQIL